MAAIVVRIEKNRQCDFGLSDTFAGHQIETLGSGGRCHNEATHICRLTGHRLCAAHADGFMVIMNTGGSEAKRALLQKYTDVSAALDIVSPGWAGGDLNPANISVSTEWVSVINESKNNEQSQPVNVDGSKG